MKRKFVNLDNEGIEGTRRVMVVKRGKVFGFICTWTQECSGCFESGEYMGNAHNYPYDSKAGCYIGSGCQECGHKGKRRISCWIPLPKSNQRKLFRTER